MDIYSKQNVKVNKKSTMLRGYISGIFILSLVVFFQANIMGIACHSWLFNCLTSDTNDHEDTRLY